METPEMTEATGTEAKRLSRRKADSLILIDIVTEKSRRVELMTRAELFDVFRERAATAPEPEVEELLESADRQMDETFGRKPGQVSFVPPPTRDKVKRAENQSKLPTMRAQREAFTRRELLRSLIAGDLEKTTSIAEAAEAEKKAEAAAAAPVEPRVITEEYFSDILAETLESDCGLAKLVSWDNVEYYHYRPLLSCTYARILSAKNNPVEQLCDLVRESSRIYPRPVVVETFQQPPFNFTPEQIQEILQQISKDPKRQDIRYTETSIGTVYLYSRTYLEDDYADFIAEHIDVDILESP